MIEVPRRSVTRFFIPLIDVLILLFCIYLLLPIVGPPGEAAEGGTDPAGEALDAAGKRELARLRQEVRELRRSPSLPEAERQELERIRTEKLETLQQRLAVRVLEIDADTGRLFYYDPERTELGNEAAARALIERQKREASPREVYYLFLFPRRLTGYPQERQVRQYERWFAGVAHGTDNPRGTR
jgi:hypothetical protein